MTVTQERDAQRDLAIGALPGWVAKAGYRPVGFAVPVDGQLFYDAKRDKVLICNEVETLSFVILRYGGER